MMESNVMTYDRRADVLSEQVVALFEAYHEPIFGYVYRLVDDAEWAHDLVQETFLRLFETRDRLADVSNPRAWVYRIASNLALNALKRRRRFSWLPWRDGDAWHDASRGSLPDPAEAVQLQRQVSRALARLTPDYRAPLLLYSHFDFTVREVAEALELSEGAVKTRLYRAREKFREAYSEDEVQNEVDK